VEVEEDVGGRRGSASSTKTGGNRVDRRDDPSPPDVTAVATMGPQFTAVSTRAVVPALKELRIARWIMRSYHG